MTGDRRASRAALAVAVGGVAASNVVGHRILPEAVHVPWNLTLLAGLAVLARRSGLTSAQLGLEEADLRRGLRTGVIAAGGIALAYAVVGRPGGSAVFHDRRASGLRPGATWRAAIVRIPLGTVLTEEFAFRSVLPALAHDAGTPIWLADIVAAVMFGFWHLLPSRAFATGNAWARRVSRDHGPSAVPAISVAGTTLAGLGLSFLRRRGHHLIAPAVAHWAANALGLVAARQAVCA